MPIMMGMKNKLSELDLHCFDLPYQSTRILHSKAIAKLMSSIEIYGQKTPVIGVSRENRILLIDGYLRFEAIKRLGKDTIRVIIDDLTVVDAVLRHLNHEQSRRYEPIEEAWLISSLLNDGLNQTDIAIRLGRNKSWISQRIALITALPESVQDAVRHGDISAWSANRVFKKLARANLEHVNLLLAALKSHALSTRELSTWFGYYQTANNKQRENMAKEPALFIRALNAKNDEKTALLQQEIGCDRISTTQKIEELLKQLKKEAIFALDRHKSEQVNQLEQDFMQLRTQFEQFQTYFQALFHDYRNNSRNDTATSCQENSNTTNQQTTKDISQYSSPGDSEPHQKPNIRSLEVAKCHVETIRSLLTSEGECSTDATTTTRGRH